MFANWKLYFVVTIAIFGHLLLKTVEGNTVLDGILDEDLDDLPSVQVNGKITKGTGSNGSAEGGSVSLGGRQVRASRQERTLTIVGELPKARIFESPITGGVGNIGDANGQSVAIAG